MMAEKDYLKELEKELKELQEKHRKRSRFLFMNIKESIPVAEKGD